MHAGGGIILGYLSLASLCSHSKRVQHFLEIGKCKYYSAQDSFPALSNYFTWLKPPLSSWIGGEKQPGKEHRLSQKLQPRTPTTSPTHVLPRLILFEGPSFPRKPHLLQSVSESAWTLPFSLTKKLARRKPPVFYWRLFRRYPWITNADAKWRVDLTAD